MTDQRTLKRIINEQRVEIQQLKNVMFMQSETIEKLSNQVEAAKTILQKESQWMPMDSTMDKLWKVLAGETPK